MGKFFRWFFFRDEKIFDQKIFGFSEMKKFSTKNFSTGIFLNFQEIFSNDADWIWAPTEQFNGPKSSKNDFRLKVDFSSLGLPGLVIFEKKVDVTQLRGLVDQLRGKRRR